jgi:hypothetical protein
MKFIPNPSIDAIKAAYKLKYDELFAQIHDAKDDPELLRKLQKKEKRLHERTKRFVAKHAKYFSDKRKYHFANMERAEMFGDRPKTDATPTNTDLRRYGCRAVYKKRGLDV